MSQSNPILTAIIHGMRQSHLSNQVRLAATTALYNSLEFTKANFDNEVRKNKLYVYFFFGFKRKQLILIFINKKKVNSTNILIKYSLTSFIDVSAIPNLRLNQ